MQLSAVCMTIVCHVSDILSDAKVYKTIVTGLFKMEICALLLDFGFCLMKVPLFPLQHTHEIDEEGQGMEPSLFLEAEGDVTKCKPKYRRPPLCGTCPKCGGMLC